tara:strand:+ start:894 stop:1073 length:180 start_codon:yes stop_codon:yes gene_type:complete
MNRKEIISEILGVVQLSQRFSVALENKLMWSQELREILNSPHTDKELLKTHFKNGTEQG